MTLSFLGHLTYLGDALERLEKKEQKAQEKKEEKSNFLAHCITRLMRNLFVLHIRASPKYVKCPKKDSVIKVSLESDLLKYD